MWDFKFVLTYAQMSQKHTVFPVKKVVWRQAGSQRQKLCAHARSLELEVLSQQITAHRAKERKGCRSDSDEFISGTKSCEDAHRQVV